MKCPKRSHYNYKVREVSISGANRAECDAGLQRRGGLTVWLSDAALDAPRTPASPLPDFPLARPPLPVQG